MVFLPKPVFKKIMGYCDNRIETTQKYHHRKVIASLSVLSCLKILADIDVKISNMDNGIFYNSSNLIRIPSLCFPINYRYH